MTRLSLTSLCQIRKVLVKRFILLDSPTAKDFTLWVAALRAISGSTFTLDRPLGNYLVIPPCVDEWYASPDSVTLYNQVLEKVRRFILVSSDATRTRSRPFAYESDVEMVPADVLLATVKHNPDIPNQVILHLVAPFPTQETKPSSFLNVLNRCTTCLSSSTSSMMVIQTNGSMKAYIVVHCV